jgi:hypothetical protein
MGGNAPTAVSSDLIGGSLTKGSGLNLFDATSTIAYATAPSLAITTLADTPDFDTALASSAWFTFDLTVEAGVTDLDLISLDLDGARGGGGTPRGYGVLVTTPTTTDELIQGATDFNTQRTTWDPQSIALSGFTSLQNLTAGDVVSFKIPVYTPGTALSLDFDNIILSGTGVAVVPEPGTISLVGLGAFTLLGLRRRQVAK